MSVTGHRRRQQGFSLIEVLVAMLVLAIGLLGLAALQTQGVRFNHDAYVRTNATSLAYDIVERMRVNRGDPLRKNPPDLSLYTTANFPPRNKMPKTGYSVEFPPYNCSSSSVSVATDLACWLNGIALGLPLGQATISRQAVPNDNLFDISLLWLDREPRDFKGVSRLAQDAGECTKATNRTWVDTPSPGQCFVTQTWTVWP